MGEIRVSIFFIFLLQQRLVEPSRIQDSGQFPILARQKEAFESPAAVGTKWHLSPATYPHLKLNDKALLCPHQAYARK